MFNICIALVSMALYVSIIFILCELDGFHKHIAWVNVVMILLNVWVLIEKLHQLL